MKFVPLFSFPISCPEFLSPPRSCRPKHMFKMSRVVKAVLFGSYTNDYDSNVNIKLSYTHFNFNHKSNNFKGVKSIVQASACFWHTLFPLRLHTINTSKGEIIPNIHGSLLLFVIYWISLLSTRIMAFPFWNCISFILSVVISFNCLYYGTISILLDRKIWNSNKSCVDRFRDFRAPAP